jgi:hypothetical protein
MAPGPYRLVQAHAVGRAPAGPPQLAPAGVRDPDAGQGGAAAAARRAARGGCCTRAQHPLSRNAALAAQRPGPGDQRAALQLHAEPKQPAPGS